MDESASMRLADNLGQHLVARLQVGNPMVDFINAAADAVRCWCFDAGLLGEAEGLGCCVFWRGVSIMGA